MNRFAFLACLLPTIALVNCSDDETSTPATQTDAGNKDAAKKDSGPVDYCDDYVDDTAKAAELAWGFNIAPENGSCIKIKVGQTVTFKPDSSFEDHPLIGVGSDSPIGQMGTGSDPYVVTFPAAGFFKFHCDIHASMVGAVQVVE